MVAETEAEIFMLLPLSFLPRFCCFAGRKTWETALYNQEIIMVPSAKANFTSFNSNLHVCNFTSTNLIHPEIDEGSKNTQSLLGVLQSTIHISSTLLDVILCVIFTKKRKERGKPKLYPGSLLGETVLLSGNRLSRSLYHPVFDPRGCFYTVGVGWWFKRRLEGWLHLHLFRKLGHRKCPRLKCSCVHAQLLSHVHSYTPWTVAC